MKMKRLYFYAFYLLTYLYLEGPIQAFTQFHLILLPKLQKNPNIEERKLVGNRQVTL